MQKNILISCSLHFLSLIFICVPAVLMHFSIIGAYGADSHNCRIKCDSTLSVNIIAGITGQLSLGQAGFMAIRAYVSIWAAQMWHFPLSICCSRWRFCSGNRFCSRFSDALKLTGDYLAIVTLGFGEIVRVVLCQCKRVYRRTKWKTTHNAFNCVSGTCMACYCIFLSVNDCPFYGIFLRSTFGSAILAVREDEIAANSCGINVFKYKMIGFVVAALVAGIGGGLYAAF